MATKYILDQIKVEGVLCELIGKSNGENVAVSYGGIEMTLAAALARILTDVAALPTADDVSAAVTALKQEMLGRTSSNPRPSRCMMSRIRLVVPLTMPESAHTVSARRRRIRLKRYGMPPPTLASIFRCTPFSFAAERSSSMR